MTNILPFLGVVLCGGKGSRMGGADKGLIEFQGQPMASYAINALASCQQTIINANRNQDSYQARFQLPVVSDIIDGFGGPLVGILTALHYAKKHKLDWVITCPCDSPFITSEYASKMWQAQQEHNNPSTPQAKVLMACDERNQPVFSLIHISLIEPLTQFLNQGNNKVLLFYQQIGICNIRFKDANLFKNINLQTEILT